MREISQSQKIVNWIAGSVAVVFAVLAPLFALALETRYVKGNLDAEVEMSSRIVTQLIHANPEMWRFEQQRLEKILAQRPLSGEKEIRRITDLQDRVIAESADALSHPLIKIAYDLKDSGITVGRLEIYRSWGPLLLHALVVSVFGLLIGIALFVTLRVMPFRALFDKEAALRDSHEKYLGLFNNIRDAIIVTDMDGDIIDLNPAFSDLFGYTVEELKGKQTDILCADERQFLELGERLKDNFGRADFLATVRLKKKSGAVFPGETNVCYLKDNSGKVVGFFGLIRDITAHRRTEEALQKSEDMLRSIFRVAPTGIGVVAQRVITMANDRLCEMTGYADTELLGQSARMLYASDEDYNYVGHEKYFQISQCGTGTVETRWKRKTGEALHVLLSSTPLNLEDLSAGVVFTALDITERIENLAELHREKEKFRVLVEGSPLGIVYLDAGGRYKYMNPKFGRMFGYSLEEIPTGDAWFKKAYPDEVYRHKIISQWMTDLKAAPIGETRPRTANVTCKDGSVKIINFKPVTLANGDQIMTCEDITEAMLLEAKLQQAQKLEAIGTLAGGIAHDFSNLLMGIQGRVSIMSVELDPLHPHIEHLKRIEEYIRSAADLTKQLLGFARGGKYEVSPIDLNAIVRNSAVMFGRTRKEIRIHTRFQEPAPVVQADLRQIEQVLLNIFVNAWQAMPDGGELYLETKDVALDREYCEPHRVEPGRYAKVSITDNGLGMEEAVLNRIFDPFFTTKDRDRGTGLGLASAYGIIKNHNGLITVYSEKGHGATFNIYLPLSGVEARREVSFSGELVKGSETILLVDDEEMIIDVGQTMLQKLGYHVVAAKGGKAAVDAVERLGGKIDLVILDMIMPDMDGGKTFDRIREIQPAIPVILSSGYALNEQADSIMRRGCNGFIQKPFSISELSHRVRSLLDRRP